MLGFDRPMAQQYVVWIFRRSCAAISATRYGVRHRCSTSNARLPVAAELGLLALIVALSIALPVGVYSAIRQDTVGDIIALVLNLAAGGTELLAGHHGGGVSLDLVGLVTGSQYMFPSARLRCRTSSQMIVQAAIVLGAESLRRDHADGTDHGAGGSSAGLHSDRLGRGSSRSSWWSCGTRCATPSTPVITLIGLQAAAADRRCRDHRTDFRHSRHGVVAAGGRQPAVTTPSSPAFSWWSVLP